MGRGTGRIVTLMIALLGTAFGAWAAYLDIGVESVLTLGSRLQSGEVIAAQAVPGLIERPLRPESGASCREDLLLAVGLTAVGVRDAAVQGGRPELVPAALGGIEATARDIMKCSPGWGMAWTWSAIARAQRGAEKEEVRSLLERSQWLSPSDYWVIALRLQSTARISSWYRGGFEGILRSDVRSLLVSELDVNTVSDVMGPVFSFIESIAQEEYSRLGDERRREGLMMAFGNWHANIAACSGVNFRDWLYRRQKGSCVEGKYIPQFDWKTFERSDEKVIKQ